MQGRILIYRVFDIGKDVNLEATQRTFESTAQRFRLNRSSKAMIINNAPLSLFVESSKYDALGKPIGFGNHGKNMAFWRSINHFIFGIA